jgi:hypothetical protein
MNVFVSKKRLFTRVNKSECVKFKKHWCTLVLLCVCALTLLSNAIQAQNIGINTANPDASSILDITHTTRGLLIPRVQLVASNNSAPVTAPALSLLVFNLLPAGVFPNDVKTGYYYWDGAKWVGIGTGNAWELIGNSGTSAGTNFIGTTDVQDLVFKTNSIENMRILNSNGNVGIGTNAPTFKLHLLNGNIKIDGNSNALNNLSYLMFGLNNGTPIGYVGDGASARGSIELCNYNGDIYIETGLVETAPKIIIFNQAGNMGLGTATPDVTAKLDITSTTSGFAMPRMTSAQRKAIVSPIDGLQVYDTNLKGIYIYDGTKWDCTNNPAGTVQYFANATAPNGYLECNGQYVNTTTYAELFAAIGTIYGPLVGTTFALPDLRGEFIRGVDNARGVDAGRGIGTGQMDDFKSHTHELPSQASGGAFVEVTIGLNSGFDIGLNPTYPTGGIETRPRNVAMLPCIKF